jgi:hypothetical protein
VVIRRFARAVLASIHSIENLFRRTVASTWQKGFNSQISARTDLSMLDVGARRRY